MEQNIFIFKDNDWHKEAAKYIHNAVQSVINKKGACSVMLTGGSSAEIVYREWSKTLFSQIRNIHFYFGDERCVNPNHCSSNYFMVINSLFSENMSENYTIYRIMGEASDKMEESKRYLGILPSEIDVLLLSIGEDGHIASLFPGDSFIYNNSKVITPVIAVKQPFYRFTVSTGIINSAKKKICLCKGKLKGAAFRSVLINVDDIISVPARIVYNADWLLDNSAASELS